MLHIDHGLLHGLEYLSLHSQHLLKRRQGGGGWRRVGIIVVVLPVVLSVVVGGTVPCVSRLKYEC
jgi:hypothetical protein